MKQKRRKQQRDCFNIIGNQEKPNVNKTTFKGEKLLL